MARNAGGEEAVDEGEQAAAESWVLDALSQAFGIFGAAEGSGQVFSGPPAWGASEEEAKVPYTVVQEVKTDFIGSGCSLPLQIPPLLT